MLVLSAGAVERGAGGTVLAGGTEIIATNASGEVFISGATVFVSGAQALLNVAAQGTAYGTAYVASGGTLVLSGAAPTGTVTIVSGSIIDITSIASGSITSVTDNGTTAVLHLSGGSSYTLNIAGPSNYQLVSDGNGGTLFEVCFAEGTHIATPDGETVVEALQPGDMVMTPQGAKPVKWMGYRSVDVSKLKNPDDGRLVRVVAGAFGKAMPHRDLLVTQEHCVLVEGNLIPARMLVNGRTIKLDRSINSFTYYHVELETHGILFAEGLTTESYLDTGNRGNFANHEAVAMQPDFSVKPGAYAAPLAVDRATVEPVWRMLAERAEEMGVASGEAPLSLITDPALSLSTDAGMSIQPMSSKNGRYLFMLPSGVTGLRLHSRTARPTETMGPFVNDRRELGVLVGEVVLHNGRKRMQMRDHLKLADLNGWFGIEDGAGRWTNGDADLFLPEQNRMTLLEVEVLNAGPYLAEADVNVNVNAAEKKSA